MDRPTAGHTPDGRQESRVHSAPACVSARRPAIQDIAGFARPTGCRPELFLALLATESIVGQLPDIGASRAPLRAGLGRLAEVTRAVPIALAGSSLRGHGDRLERSGQARVGIPATAVGPGC